MSATFAVGGLLCLAGLAFPFSVAATNIFLGGVLILGVFSGQWWQGASRLWRGRNRLVIALFAYLTLVGLGLMWSIDQGWGLHILKRHWFWLLIPVCVSIFGISTWRERFLLALTAGLALHLGFCVLQKFGVVIVTTDGSTAVDATGHIGHIGFGFVYGVWAAWLLHWGWLHHGWRRHGAWLLAAWAWAMIFLAQGRSGYLIAVVLLCIVLWRHFAYGTPRHTLIQVSGLIILLIGLTMYAAAGSRMTQTWSGLKAMYTSGLTKASSIDERWGLWVMALEVWKKNPLLGVGTGGFREASKEIDQVKLVSNQLVVHPHNIYLLALARWGILGLGILGWLIYEWIRYGWQLDWVQYEVVSLASLSGIALAVHGFSSSSLEEHFSAVYAVLLLSLALAETAEHAIED